MVMSYFNHFKGGAVLWIRIMLMRMRIFFYADADPAFYFDADAAGSDFLLDAVSGTFGSGELEI
jgi:hypothetical protein